MWWCAKHKMRKGIKKNGEGQTLNRTGPLLISLGVCSLDLPAATLRAISGDWS